MKKRTLLAMVALSALLAACGKNESASTAAAPVAAPVPAAMTKLVIGLDDNFPPMGFRDDKNEIVGFDIDMAREAAKRMNVEVDFKPIDWSAKEAELVGKRVDALWNGLTITEERKKNIAFTAPYMENHQIIIVRADSDIKDKAGLAGKVVGAQDGSSAVDAIKKDAVVVDEVVGRFHVAKKAGEYLVLEDNFGTEDYGVGLRKEDTEVLGKLEAALAEMKKDGKAAEIASKWFGKDIIK